MLTYAFRRVLYSIPVVLIASFLLVLGRARDVRSHRPARRTRRIRRSSSASANASASTSRSSCSTRTGSQGAVHGDFGQSSASRDDVSTMISRAMGNTLQLIIIGAVVSAAIAIGVGVYSSVKQYSKLDYLFTGAVLHRHRHASVLVRLAADRVLRRPEPMVPVRRAAHGRQHRLQLGLRQTSRAPDRHTVRADRRVVEPLPACVDARRAGRRLRAHRARQGRAAAQGDLQARLAQLARSRSSPSSPSTSARCSVA